LECVIEDGGWLNCCVLLLDDLVLVGVFVGGFVVVDMGVWFGEVCVFVIGVVLLYDVGGFVVWVVYFEDFFVMCGFVEVEVGFGFVFYDFGDLCDVEFDDDV